MVIELKSAKIRSFDNEIVIGCVRVCVCVCVGECVDGGFMPLPTCPQRYRDPAPLVLKLTSTFRVAFLTPFTSGGLVPQPLGTKLPSFFFSNLQTSYPVQCAGDITSVFFVTC